MYAFSSWFLVRCKGADVIYSNVDGFDFVVLLVLSSVERFRMTS